LSRLPRWLWLLALLAALAWHWNSARPVRHLPGILVAAVPLQQKLDGDASLQALRKGDVALKPLAKFSLSARVLSRADYHWDTLAALVPVDLALGWGRMSDSAILEKVEISQSGRFFHWHVDQFPIPEREIIESAANMHLIPADNGVERAIKRARVGDIVTFDGLLVEIDWPNGARAVSSLTRSDTGAGACEIVWVENFAIAP
jgi:hypothetical protein